MKEIIYKNEVVNQRVVSGVPHKLYCLNFKRTPLFGGKHGSDKVLLRVFIKLKWTALLLGRGECVGVEEKTAGELTCICEDSLKRDVLGKLCVE